MGQFLSVAVAIGVPLVSGIGIGLSIQDDVKGWYKGLKRPSWTPPDWLFGPVWTMLYTGMGYASYLVWKNGGGRLPLSLYAAQLLLNMAWSPLFFKKHEIGFALLDITALLGVLGATIVEFNKVSPTAAYLLLPYFAWTSFATALTANIYANNPQARGKKSEEARRQVEDAADNVAQKASEAASKVKESASAAVDKISGNNGASDKAASAADDAKNAASKAGDAAKDTAKDAKGEASKLADQAQAKVA